MNKRLIGWAIIIGIITIIYACDRKAIGSPDIRKEFKNEEKKPDYFGWRFNFKF